MKKILGVLVALALVFTFCGSALAADKMLSAFKLKTGAGGEITQAAFKDKKVMLVFSQMACRQCRFEMEELNAKADELKGKVFIVLVDMNTEAALKQYNELYKLEVILDPDFSIPASFALMTTPATVVLDKTGKVSFEKVGYVRGTVDDLLKNLQ
ncbi:TlpA family protein disulfide reductase [bacterium]|nr:MAG: TlpA family protein disulfide reductase [bacterium]